jgi:hypothetical protein
VTSVVGGGKCGPGALSAAASKALVVTGVTDTKDIVSGTIVSAVTGGTVSVLGGGKFANGAQTGAFSYLFNYCAHAADCWRQAQEQVAKVWLGIGKAVGDVIWALTPGTASIDCIQQGCTAIAAAAAAADFVPGGKAVALGEKGLAHVLARHIAGGAESAGKSLFNSAADLAALATNASAVAPVASGRNFVRVVDAGAPIGIDRATDQATSAYTVVTNRAGDVVTMHPGVPRGP